MQAMTTLAGCGWVGRCVVVLPRHRDVIAKVCGRSTPRPPRPLRRVHEAWGDRYPAIVRLWEQAWAEFVPFLAFDAEIRTIVCSTNVIEGVNARIMKGYPPFSADAPVFGKHPPVADRSIGLDGDGPGDPKTRSRQERASAGPVAMASCCKGGRHLGANPL